MRRAWLLALILALAGCGDPEPVRARVDTDVALDAIPVRVSVVEQRPIEDTVALLGTIVPSDKALIGAEMDGRVEAVLVKEGDRVAANTPLVKLVAAEASLQMQAAQGVHARALAEAEADERIARARADQGRTEVDRVKERVESEIASTRAKLDEVQARYRQLKRGPRPQEIGKAQSDVNGAKLILESNKQLAAFSERTLKRKEELFDKGYIPENERDEAKLDAAQAQQAVLFAEEQLTAKELILKLLKEGTPKEEMDQAAAQVRAAEQDLRAVTAGRKTIEQKRLEYEATLADLKRASVRLGSARSEAGANLQLAEQNLEKTIVRAPLDGRVVSLKVGRGQFVHSGDAVAEVSGLGGLKVEATAIDSEAGRVRPGLHVRLRLRTDPTRQLQGRVLRALPPGSDQGTSFRVTVQLDDTAGLAAGMVATGEVVVRDLQDTLLVTADAFEDVGPGDLASAYVVRDGRVRHTQVRLGQRIGEFLEVVSGLQSGDQVVVEGRSLLQEGSLVRIEGGSG